jgi:hypothetical protein
MCKFIALGLARRCEWADMFTDFKNVTLTRDGPRSQRTVTNPITKIESIESGFYNSYQVTADYPSAMHNLTSMFWLGVLYFFLAWYVDNKVHV